MKLAVISDMHGNLPALQATLAHVDRWKPDITVVNGDVVNRGPRPRECWELVSDRSRADGWRIVSGNHEEYVSNSADEQRELKRTRLEIYRSAYWTYLQMNGLVSEIRKLPAYVELNGPDGSTVRLTHASMRANDDGIYPQTADEELAKQIAPAPDVFCTAHTHRPLVRWLDGTLVVNSGSAGTAFDGDPRISYAQISWRQRLWSADIVRVAYDRAQASRDFEESGYRRSAGPLVDIFYQEWLLARPMVNRWAARYQRAVLTGDLDLRDSVDAFLQSVL
ncbi:MAG TPA: metallophosphoesterase family protein [Candidatus Binatia bacterium]|nr:metallophosphoesterase family protein [Candidatus Binatia bacterium]